VPVVWRDVAATPEGTGVEALVFECLERLETEGEAALEDLCRAHPEHAASLRARIAFLRRMGLRAGPDGAFALPQRLGEFRLIERLGTGGMGVVYLAEQTSLHRTVALKLIRPEQLYFANARERFRREIDAIARLQHPSIVPIFATGEEGGIPYYAMEHVRGVSLAHVIAAFADRDPMQLTGRDLRDLVVAASPTDADPAGEVFTGSWTEVATKIALALSLAVQHAHERGVLHRDVKPSNVMIAADGRVVLLDFGLASLGESSALTRTGSQIGSMPYMAPEQLRAQVERIGARTDVYAIGVTLYEMLALHPAFLDRGDTEALRREILSGRTQGQKEIRRGVPGDLAIVCRTAMQAESAARYPSAAELAADLQNVLALRPIAARAPSVAARVSSWARRNPARATAVLLAIALVFGGPLVFALQQIAANRRVEKVNVDLAAALKASERERARADVERIAADRSAKQAVAAVDTMLTRVGRETLLDVPQMVSVRRELFQDALRFYSEFLAEKEGDPALRRAVERSRDRVSAMDMMLGDLDAAESGMTQLCGTLRERAAASDADDETLRTFAFVVGRLGELQTRRGKYDEARGFIDEAVTASERIPEERRTALAEMQRSGNVDKLAELAQRRGDEKEAEAAARRAVAISRAGFERHPGAYGFELGLGRQLDRLGTILLRARRVDESVAALAESVTRLEAYRTHEPTDAHGKEKLAAASINCSNALATSGRLDDARASSERAVKIGEELVRDFPEVPSYRTDLALARQQLFVFAYHADDLETAAAHLTRALELQASVAIDRKGDPTFSAELAHGCNNLAVLELRRERGREAVASTDRGLAHVAAALQASPKNKLWQEVRNSLQNNRAMGLLTLGEWRDAVASADLVGNDGTHRWYSCRAQILERASRIAATDETLAADARTQESSALRERALAQLTEAVRLGRTDWSELPDPDEWTSLRGDPRFDALVAQAPSKR
jgi:serine/threonine protein kinase